MRRRSKAIAATITIVTVSAIILLATLQAALTTESARNEQNPAFAEPRRSVQAGLDEDATANNLTLRVTSVMNSTDPEARHVWATYDSDMYAPLNPVQGSKYVILNVSAVNAMNGTASFRYTDSVLVGNDGRSYYANYGVGNTSCTAALAAEQLNSNGACTVYIAFSVPNDVAPAKIVDESTNPAIVISLV